MEKMETIIDKTETADKASANKESNGHSQSVIFGKALNESAMAARPSQPGKSYLAAVVLIVRDSFHLSSANPTPAEVLERAEIWARVLYPIIDECYLQECFDEAFRVHGDGYAINAYDIKNAFTEVIRRRNDSDRQLSPASFENCDQCGGTGFEYITSKDGRSNGVRKCRHGRVFEKEVAKA